MFTSSIVQQELRTHRRHGLNNRQQQIIKGLEPLASDKGMLDFAVSSRSFPMADMVVLDWVVCCHPNATALLEKAARHSDQALVFTYPRPLWFMPLFRALCALGIKVMRREYRFFLHDPVVLLEAATSNGHQHEETCSVGIWRLVTLKKVL